MLHSPSMADRGSIAVIDALNSLLESLLNSIFRFMGEGSPYLGRASAEIRRPLQEMVDAQNRQTRELAEMIVELGGEPAPPSIQPEEQYLAYLSLKFLLPRLAQAKELTIERYENALQAIGKTAPAEVVRLLEEQLAEHRGHLEILNKAAEDVKRK
jgi:bacterioferritin (cytochrome b1)